MSPVVTVRAQFRLDQLFEATGSDGQVLGPAEHGRRPARPATAATVSAAALASLASLIGRR